MSEKLFPHDAITTASHIEPELPQTRQAKKGNPDLVEVNLVPLSPGDQQLAALPEELADKIFVKLALKGISAL